MVDFNPEKLKFNLYGALGVAENASADDIKKAYRKIAVANHPDKTKHLPKEQQDASAEVFRKAAEAYEVLSNDQKRTSYNAHINQQRQQHTNQPHVYANPWDQMPSWMKRDINTGEREHWSVHFKPGDPLPDHIKEYIKKTYPWFADLVDESVDEINARTEKLKREYAAEKAKEERIAQAEYDKEEKRLAAMRGPRLRIEMALAGVVWEALTVSLDQNATPGAHTVLEAAGTYAPMAVGFGLGYGLMRWGLQKNRASALLGALCISSFVHIGARLVTRERGTAEAPQTKNQASAPQAHSALVPNDQAAATLADIVKRQPNTYVWGQATPALNCKMT